MLILFTRSLWTLSTYKELGVDDYIDAKWRGKTTGRDSKSKKKKKNHYWALKREQKQNKRVAKGDNVTSTHGNCSYGNEVLLSDILKHEFIRRRKIEQIM